MKTSIIGARYKSNKYGDFIVNKFLFRKGWAYYYEIQFVNTGAISTANNGAIARGSVRDSYAKTIYGVACMGNIKAKHGTIEHIAFKRWLAMIARCYEPKSMEYNSYGAKGVYVSDRWLVFENYMKDIRNIIGFDEEKYIAGQIQLDKDIKTGGIEYSKDTCIFVDRSVNANYQPTKSKPFIAIAPDGKTMHYLFQSTCAKENGLTARTIGKVLNGQLKTHKGWKFVYERKGGEFA